jgi:hypothetical protein
MSEITNNHGNLGGGALGTYGPSGKDEDFARRVHEEIFTLQNTPPSFSVWRFGTVTAYDKNGPIKKKK